MQPFTWDTIKVLSLLLVMGAIFYFLQFPFHPLVNIGLKCALMSLMYVGVLYRFKISEDVFGVLNKWLKR